MFCFFFFFNDTATTEIYTLSLHDALPISEEKSFARAVEHDDLGLRVHRTGELVAPAEPGGGGTAEALGALVGDRKSTRLNSSHLVISYAVFCLKKKKCLTGSGSVWS